MPPGQRDEVLAAEWVMFRELRTTAKSEEALRLTERMVAESTDPFRVAQALIARLATHHAARNKDALMPLLRDVEQQLSAAPHPRLVGEYHMLSSAIAYDQRSYGVALIHVVEAERALRRMDERTRAAVDAWHDLAAAYTVLGYHARALDAADRCQSLCDEAGLPSVYGIAFYAYVHAALVLDQRGDTAGCVRQLTELAERARPLLPDLPAAHRVMLGYAVRRLAVLDHALALDVPAVREVGPNLIRINTLGEVCAALAARRAERALALLDAASEPLDVFGVGEALRLRSLALVQLGDHAGALDTERALHLLSSQEEGELRRLLADNAGVRIDQEQLRQSAERHARAAMTDSLTGLPNRRRAEAFLAELTGGGKAAVIGVLDLDGFKAVNDNHGHPTGDMVLQRVAGILAREVRPADLVARPGGDEFVIVLPGTSKDDAETLGERIEAAVVNQDWQSVVPGTPVAISVGWAELTADADAAFRSADRALYDAKRAHHARSAGCGLAPDDHR